MTEQHWDTLLHDCCGDSVTGWALHNEGVDLSGLWPMFNPHPPHGLPFSDLYWCQPMIGMHKPKEDDVQGLFRWEHGHRQYNVSDSRESAEIPRQEADCAQSVLCSSETWPYHTTTSRHSIAKRIGTTQAGTLSARQLQASITRKTQRSRLTSARRRVRRIRIACSGHTDRISARSCDRSGWGSRGSWERRKTTSWLPPRTSSLPDGRQTGSRTGSSSIRVMKCSG